MTNTTPQEIALQKLADRWNVAKITVWRWHKSGLLPGRRKGPGKTSPIMIRMEDVERFEREFGLVHPEA